MTPHSESELDVPAAATGPMLPPRLAAPVANVLSGDASGFQPPVQFVPQGPAQQSPRRRRPFVFVVLLVLAAAGTLYVLVLRQSDDDATVSAPDPSAQPDDSVVEASGGLPDLHFERPALTSAAWNDTLHELQEDDDHAVQIVTSKIASLADYTRAVARLDLTTPGFPDPVTYVFTPDYVYWPSDVDGGPWTRQANTDEPSRDAPFDARFLDVYDDMVTEQMRADATNVTTTTSVVAGSTLTTYAFDVQASDISGDLRDEFNAIDDLGDMVGHMEVSIDKTGLVQHWSFGLDEAAMRSALTADSPAASDPLLAGRDLTTSEPLMFGRDIISINQPVDIVLPADFVDQLSEQCSVERKTLQIALEAWVAQYGDANVPTEAQLFADGFIRKQSDIYDVVNGEVIAVAGGPCDVAG